ncbi:MAG: pilin [Patescibacteria group bacterium]
MIKKILKKTYLLIIPVLVFGLPFFASATLPPPGEGGSISNPLNSTSFDELISAIAYWIFIIAIPLATLMFLIGGFMVMVSGGSDEKVTQAQKTMLWAAVGLAVCLIGAGFTSIIKELLGAN